MTTDKDWREVNVHNGENVAERQDGARNYHRRKSPTKLPDLEGTLKSSSSKQSGTESHNEWIEVNDMFRILDIQDSRNQYENLVYEFPSLNILEHKQEQSCNTSSSIAARKHASSSTDHSR
jgi:hypothetical protein